MCCNNMILIFNFLNTATPLKTKITEQRCSTNKRGGATKKKKKALSIRKGATLPLEEI